jgi:hypothetical protein
MYIQVLRSGNLHFSPDTRNRSDGFILILHALGRTGELTELIDRYGIDMTKTLWDAIDSSTLEWVRSLEFGFVELDCFLIHGSSISVSDELTPTIDPIQAIDKSLRLSFAKLMEPNKISRSQVVR